MTDLVLTIGDKALSSWSFRPWFAMRHSGVDFKEETIRLDTPATRTQLRDKAPAGLVPFLRHGDLEIWDSLAIMEYVNSIFPEINLWPDDLKAAGVARAVSAEMHSGFMNLRTVWPMNFNRRDLRHVTSGGVQKDVDRILDIWRLCRQNYSVDGPFLFGAFSIADAMYAPVVSRFMTYGPIKTDAVTGDYMRTISETAAFREWADGAAQETTVGIASS
ncbi:MAG: glutathione S-transferase family protein [Pseudomonadota bacterium]